VVDYDEVVVVVVVGVALLAFVGVLVFGLQLRGLVVVEFSSYPFSPKNIHTTC
jgi:hypothetical protein